MCLVGYEIVKAGDTLWQRGIQGVPENYTVPEGHELIGATTWIFKNATTINAGRGGYRYYVIDGTNNYLGSINTVISPYNIIGNNYEVLCLDEDNDGYYNWGIGPKPSSCPTCPDEPDCDDSNPFLGPFDDRYGCTLLCENFHYDATPITINEDETWYDVNYINQDIIVNSDTLYIFDELQMHDSAGITVKNGGVFILGENATLKGACNDTIYSGNITVEPGGILKFGENTNVFMNSSGSIFVDHNQTDDGMLIVDKNFNLQLLDNSTSLEIKGQLEICDTTTFTYTGDGYIKFSNPGGDATNNIFCGTGASIVLQGSGQNDKIMKVQQSTVRFPDGLSSLEFRDGKIEMGPDRRMLAQVNDQYPIVMDNIKITSDDGTNNAHRSFWFYGQNDVTIQNCTFENGKYGLGAHNTYGGASISLSGSDFINNQTGLHVYDKGVHLSYCEFTNNNTALDCEAMSFGSDLYRTNMFSNDYGAIYHGSSGADLDVDICEIQNNNYDGIRSSGNFDMDVYCTYINNNRYGIYTQAGTDVHIENDAQNDFSDNDKTIYLDYGKIFANQGYNRLQSVNNDYAIYGLTDIGTRCGPTDLYATNNQWEDNPDVGPSYSYNYILWLRGCFPMEPVTIIDNNPMVHFCSHYLVKGLNEDESSDTLTQEETETSALPLVLVSDDQSLPLDEAVYTLPVQLEQVQSAVDYQAMINTYIDIIEACDAYDNADVHYYKDIAWGHLHDVVDAYFAFISHDTENAGFNQSLDDVMLLNETLMENPDVSQIACYEYALDNALLERLRENYNQSLDMLESLKFDIPEMDREITYIDRWQCYVEAEREAKLGNLHPDDFMAAIQDCRQTYNNTMETIHDQDSLNDPGTEPGEDTTTPSPNLTIIPNPNPGNFTIEVYCETAAGDIKINNIYGQPVRTITLTGDGQQSVQVSGLAQGQYTVYYLQNGTVLDSENMIVE